MSPSRKYGPRRSAQQWRALIEQFHRSGQSAAAFAAAHQLSSSSFHHWRKRLASLDRLEPAAPTRERKLIPIAVEITAPCEIVLKNNRVLRFSPSLDPRLLRALLVAIEAP